MKKRFLACVMTFVLTMAAMPLSLLANEEWPVLTVEAATNMALANSNFMRQLEDDRTLNTEAGRQAREAAREAEDEVSRINAAVQRMQTDALSAYLSDSVNIQRDRMRFSIIQFFSSVENAVRDLELFDKQLDLAERELTIALARHSMGRMSASDFAAANDNIERMQRDRDSLELALDRAFQALNELMGRNARTRYTISLNFTYQPLPEAMPLEAYISRAIGACTTLRRLRREWEVQLYIYEVNVNPNPGQRGAIRTIPIDQAARAMNNQRDAISSSVTSAFGDVIALQTQYEASLLSLEAMRRQLVIYETMLELGRITELHLENHKLQIAQSEESLRRLVVSHAIQKMRLDNPNLA